MKLNIKINNFLITKLNLLHLFVQGLFGHLLNSAFSEANAPSSVSQQGKLKAAFRQLHFTWCWVSKVAEAFRLQWERLALGLMSLEQTQTFGVFHPCSSQCSQLALQSTNPTSPPAAVFSFFTSLSLQAVLSLYLSRFVSLPGRVVSSVGSAQHQLWLCAALLSCLLAVNALPCFLLLLLH